MNGTVSSICCVTTSPRDAPSVWSPIAISGKELTYGHTRKNCDVVVSGGLGCSIMPFRIGVPPEIVLLDLGHPPAVAALRHEAGDDAVERHAVIETFLRQHDDARDMVRRQVRAQLDHDIAFGLAGLGLQVRNGENGEATAGGTRIAGYLIDLIGLRCHKAIAVGVDGMTVNPVGLILPQLIWIQLARSNDEVTLLTIDLIAVHR